MHTDPTKYNPPTDALFASLWVRDTDFSRVFYGRIMRRFIMYPKSSSEVRSFRTLFSEISSKPSLKLHKTRVKALKCALFKHCTFNRVMDNFCL